jgi:pSer/pThr/pTyr-binding forkhead associated (FHA) protein
MLRILLKFNRSIIKELKIDRDEIIIGRDSGNDVQIDNEAVSREHAKIIRDQNYYLIEDLTSTNGTFVNGKQVKKSARK